MKKLTLFFLLSSCLLLLGAIPPPYQPTQLTTNVAKASPSNSVFVVTNATTGWGHWVLLSVVSGGTTNAVSTIQSNGATVTATATNLNFSSGTNIDWKITNSPDGHVSAAAHLNPAVTTGASNYTDARLQGYVENLSGQATNLSVRSPVGGPSLSLTVDTNRIVVTNGNVGVGTANPLRTLHVTSGSVAARLERSSAGPTTGHLDLYNPDTTDGNAVTFDFLGDTTGVGASSGQAFSSVRSILTTHDHPTRAGDMLLMTLTPSGSTEKVRIKSLGQVGVGTNNPQARLHVVGDGSSTNLIRAGLTSADPVFWVDTNSHVRASNGFRLSTNSAFQDDEWITEDRLQNVIAELHGTTYFLQTNAHPVIAGALATRLTKEVEQSLTNVLAAGSNQIAVWFSTNLVTSGVIPEGEYEIHFHARKTAGGPDVHVGFDVVRTNGSGIVTVVSGETNLIVGTIELSLNLHAHLDNDLVVSPTDYIGVRLYAVRGGAAVSLVTRVGGTTDSHFSTPSLHGGVITTTIDVQTNGVSALGTASAINFVKGTNTQVLATNMGSGVVDVAVHATGGGGVSFSQSALVSTNPLTIDMAGTIYQTVTLTNDALILATNIAQAKVVWLNIDAGASNRVLSFGTNWTFENTLRPAALASNTSAILELRSWGSINSNVTARWNPLNYSGNWSPSNSAVLPTVWMIGDTLVGASNSAISTWTNYGRLTNDFTQATAGNQPVLYTNYLNGHSVVFFNPVSASVRRLAMSGASGFFYLSDSLYAFMVIQPVAYSNYTAGQGYNSQVIFGTGNSGNSYDYGIGMGSIGGTPRLNSYTENNAISGVASWNVEATNLLGGTPWLIGNWVVDGMNSSVEFLCSATRISSGNQLGSTQINLADCYIGHEPDFGQAYNGYVAEIVVFSDEIIKAPAEQQKVEGYLAWKYGLQTNLPPDHVYKNSAP